MEIVLGNLSIGTRPLMMFDHLRVCFTFHAGDVFLLEELALYFAQKRVIHLIVIV